MALAHPPGDSIEEMCLAETGGRMDEQRIEADWQARLRLRDALRRRVGEAVRSAGDEGVEGLARIERRAALGGRMVEGRRRQCDHPACRLRLVLARTAPLGDILRALRHAPGADFDVHIVEMTEFRFAR